MHNVIDLNLCVFVHDDHSSLSWILEYHASKLSILDDEHQVTIHLINSGTQLDSSDLSFLDNYDINISVWNLFNLSLAEKILYWYNAVNLKSNSLVWFHPADQISIIDIQYFVNINFDFTSPTVYSGYEFFIHKSLVPNRQSSDVRICSSRAQLSVDSPNDLPFLNLQIQALFWEVYNTKALDIFIQILKSVVKIPHLTDQTYPGLTETFLSYIFSSGSSRIRIPMVCFFDVMRSDTKNINSTNRPLFLPEIVSILKNNPLSMCEVDTLIKKYFLPYSSHLPTPCLQLLESLSISSARGYGKFFHQLNTYILDPFNRTCLVSDNFYFSFSLSYILYLHSTSPDSIPDLSPCPLSLSSIRDLFVDTPEELWL